MTSRNDFHRDGGKFVNFSRKGKVECRCVSCGKREYLFVSAFDRASRPRCGSCGWELERSTASHDRTIMAAMVRSKAKGSVQPEQARYRKQRR